MYVGSIRRKRQDSAWRTVASKAMNLLREKITGIRMTDQGNMLRAYGRNVVDLINQCQEVNTFVPALAYTFARKETEIVVEHEERSAGESKYSLYSLIRLNFDLVTGFSIMPLQLFSLIDRAVLRRRLFVILVVRRLFGAVQGVFTVRLAFFLMGMSCSASAWSANMSAASISRSARFALWCKPCWQSSAEDKQAS